jgi:hypothetical protein
MRWIWSIFTGTSITESRNPDEGQTTNIESRVNGRFAQFLSIPSRDISNMERALSDSDGEKDFDIYE